MAWIRGVIVVPSSTAGVFLKTMCVWLTETLMVDGVALLPGLSWKFDAHQLSKNCTLTMSRLNVNASSYVGNHLNWSPRKTKLSICSNLLMKDTFAARWGTRYCIACNRQIHSNTEIISPATLLWQRTKRVISYHWISLTQEPSLVPSLDWFLLFALQAVPQQQHLDCQQKWWWWAAFQRICYQNI